MKDITAVQKKELRAEAHGLKPVIQIGQKGLTPSLIEAVDKALTDHELIKIKFMDFKDEKRNLTEELLKNTGAHLISVIGNVVILYRENEEIE